MRTSMLALGFSLLTLVSGVGCKPPAGSSVLDGEGGAGSVPFYLKMSYTPGTYTIDLGGMRSGGQAAGGLPAGWRLDAGAPRFHGSSAAPFVAAGQPIRLQFEMRLVQDSSAGTSGAAGGSRACGGEAFNPGGIELKTTSDGTINCDPAFGGSSGSGSQWCDSKGQCYPYCTSSADDDKDGFGWEPALKGPNGGSCRIRSSGDQNSWCDEKGTCYPYCKGTADDDGDGYGWEPELKGPSGGSCRIRSSVAAAGSNQWCDDKGTCYPYCTSSVDDNGDGFGWEPALKGPNGGSCRIRSNVSSTSTAQSVNASAGKWCDENNSVCYPYCTNAADDGRGFGWQPELGGPNGGSCKIAAGGTPVAGTNSAPTATPSANSGAGQWCDEFNSVCYPYCTNATDDGSGFGWQPELGGPNGGSCKMRGGSAPAQAAAQPAWPSTPQPMPQPMPQPLPQPAAGNSNQYCDGSGTCYPYCTNGVDTGGGFGWQPELGGPNGGSCKIP